MNIVDKLEQLVNKVDNAVTGINRLPLANGEHVEKRVVGGTKTVTPEVCTKEIIKPLEKRVSNEKFLTEFERKSW